jgi:hypothetical protein
MLFAMLFDRRGDVYAWVATLVVFVAIPLASLSIDVVRLMYVRTHLQAANDAACQAAADALDAPHFIATGQKRINHALARSQANRVFSATLGDAARVGFNYSLALAYPAPTFAHCTASANVEHMIPITPPMRVVVKTTSEMRAERHGR